jgi:Translation initiation factor IF-2, N-terminal region
MATGSKVRVYEVAKELKLDTKFIIEQLRREGADVEVPSNSVSKEIADKIRNKYFPKPDVAPKRKIRHIKSSEISDINKHQKQSSNTAKKLLEKCAYCGKQVFEISIHSKDCLRNPKNIKFNEEVVEIRFEKKEIDHLPYPIEGKKSKKNCPNCGRSLPMAQSNICYDCKDK